MSKVVDPITYCIGRVDAQYDKCMYGYNTVVSLITMGVVTLEWPSQCFNVHTSQALFYFLS